MKKKNCDKIGDDDEICCTYQRKKILHSTHLLHSNILIREKEKKKTFQGILVRHLNILQQFGVEKFLRLFCSICAVVENKVKFFTLPEVEKKV